MPAFLRQFSSAMGLSCLGIAVGTTPLSKPLRRAIHLITDSIGAEGRVILWPKVLSVHVCRIYCANPRPAMFPIQGAGQFIAKLCNKLIDGLPRLLGNPIGQLLQMLQTIDLKELESLESAVSTDSGSKLAGDDPEGRTFLQAQQKTLQRLQQVEQVFLRRLAET